MPASRSNALLNELRRRGVRLWVEDGQLRYFAPPGAFTARLKAEVGSLREEVLRQLSMRPTSTPQPPVVEGAVAVWAPSEMQASLVRDARPNVAAAARWRGRVDQNAFDIALNRVMQRHAVLRTRYLHEEAGVPWAVTESAVSVPTRTTDLRSFEPAARESRAMQIAATAIGESFAMDASPLLRAEILILAEDDAWFVFVVHHSLFDAPSRGILIRDFLSFYAARLENRDVHLDPLPLQYADFAREQRALQTSRSGLRTLEYWRNTLAGASEIFRLPYDRNPAAAGTPKAVRGGLSPHVLKAMRHVARQCHCTLFLAMAAVFALLLVRWSGRSDVAFWVLDTGRGRAELQSMIGNFINFWPLRVDLGADPRFDEALRKMLHKYTEALPHAHVTRSQLRPELDRIRNGKFIPGICLNFIPCDSAYRAMGTASGPYAAAAVDGATPGAFIALSVTMVEAEEDLHWFVEYSGALFEARTIQRASAALAYACAVLTEKSAAPMGELMPDGIAARRCEPLLD